MWRFLSARGNFPQGETSFLLRRLGGQLSQDIRQNAAVPEVFKLIQGVDS
jgi:hypothetical protein